MTAVQLVQVMVESQQPLSQLRQVMKRYPQLLENVQVRDKRAWRENEAIQRALRAAEEALGESGRVLVRESGTEQLVRVMVEGPDDKLLRKVCGEIVKVVQAELGV
ncbi:hypothetical protein GCM10025858_14980 [Alicyclobacillus sacchari]|nr:hypothetical protein GCM10025858_14980 [Alicyclobacillus sacchari]